MNKPFGRHMSRISIITIIFILKIIIQSGCSAVDIVEIIIARTIQLNVTEQIKKNDIILFLYWKGAQILIYIHSLSLFRCANREIEKSQTQKICRVGWKIV